MSDRFFVATRKGLFSLNRATGRNPAWQVDGVHFLGDPVTMVLPDRRDGTLHVALNLGHFGVKMRRSRNGGKHWEETAVPAYPLEPEPKQGEGVVTAPSLVLIWAMEAGGADEPGVLWAGTIPGGLFRSGNGGESWELISGLWDRKERTEWFGGGYDQPGIHSICIDPRDSRRIMAAISCGGVWRTEDGGETWRLGGGGMRAEYMPPERRTDPNIQDPHRMVQCARAPERLWVQHHSGIYRSDDGGAHWQEIEGVSPSVFGFAVAVHPNEPDTAWFVPAKKDECRVPVDGELAVTRTRDAGGSFELLREGLPKETAYDLVYRHGLAVDDSGERLVMGSTTGGLWISENQGDSWQCLSTHLPPINCVRFA